MLKQRIGLIGAGQMATALAQGWIQAGLLAPEAILASDPLPEARQRFSQLSGGRATDDNQQVVAHADVLLLAVKPQQMPTVVPALRGGLNSDNLVISIAAGVRLERLAHWLGNKPRLVRVMPNTPCLIRQGACAYCLGETAGADDGQLVEELLRAVGLAYRVDEKLMDAVTGLSGSGPAFAYVIIEALSDAGVKVGLPRQVALSLAAQTLRGAAEMVLASGDHPGVLKDRVASPGGTTIAGLTALESGGLRAALINAVEAATRRSTELGAA